MNEIKNFLPTLPVFIAATNAASSAFSFSQLSLSEKTSKQMGEKILFQMGGIYFAQSFVNRALEGSGKPGLSFTQRWSVRLFPLVLGTAIDVLDPKNPRQEKIQSALCFLQNYITPLSRAAILVSCVALFYFGHTLLAAASLAELGVEFLDQTGSLASGLKLAFLGASMTSLALNKQFFTLTLNLLFWAYYLNSSQPVPQEGALKGTAWIGSSRLKIRESALLDFKNSATPNLSLESLEFLEAQIREQSSENTDDETSEILSNQIESARTQLNQLQPGSKLENPMFGYLEIVIQHMKKKRDNGESDWQKGFNTLQQSIIKYNGLYETVFSQAVEDAYDSIRCQLPDQPLRSKLLFTLDNARKKLLRNLTKNNYNQIFLDREADPEGKYSNYYACANAFQSVFKINSFNASKDSSVAFCPMSKLFSMMPSLFCTKSFHDLVEIEKSISNLHFTREQISQAIQSGDIPRKEVLSWWGNWINKESSSDEERKSLATTLRLHEFKTQSRIETSIIDGMLLDMGILQIS